MGTLLVSCAVRRGILLNPRATACSSTFPAHEADNLAMQASKWSLEISIPHVGIDSVLQSDNKLCSPRRTELCNSWGYIVQLAESRDFDTIMSPVGLGSKNDLLAKTTRNLPTDEFHCVNWVMGPDRIRNQERLCWRGSASIYCFAMLSVSLYLWH
jgi:hypothetical protein